MLLAESVPKGDKPMPSTKVDCDLAGCARLVEVDTFGGTTFSCFDETEGNRVKKRFCSLAHQVQYEQKPRRPASLTELLAAEFTPASDWAGNFEPGALVQK
jgi:hypothetical protein